MLRNSTIQPKKKICKSCGVSSYIFSRGRCQQCARREDAKPIAKVSEKGKIKREAKKDLIEEDKLFYMEVWAASNERCYECGRKLSNPPSLLYFHHAMPKRLFPALRHVHENIILLCPDHHQQVEVNIDKAPRTKALTEQIRKQLLQ